MNFSFNAAGELVIGWTEQREIRDGYQLYGTEPVEMWKALPPSEALRLKAFLDANAEKLNDGAKLAIARQGKQREIDLLQAKIDELRKGMA